MRNFSTHKTEAMLIAGEEYTEFKQAISQLWQAQAMAEIIATSNIEHLDALTLQTATRGIAQFVEKSVMTLEEIGVLATETTAETAQEAQATQGGVYA